MKTTFKTVAIMSAIILLSGCGKIEPTEATIIKVVTETTEWGCIGTNRKTTIKTTEGYVSTLCGEYGEVGDTLNGWWKSGHFDASVNGFRTTN